VLRLFLTGPYVDIPQLVARRHATAARAENLQSHSNRYPPSARCVAPRRAPGARARAAREHPKRDSTLGKFGIEEDAPPQKLR
jgi:hypothetical protein